VLELQISGKRWPLIRSWPINSGLQGIPRERFINGLTPLWRCMVHNSADDICIYTVVLEASGMSGSPNDTLQKCWPAATRFGFRFAFVYLILYNLPFPLYYVPGAYRVSDSYEQVLHKTVPWVGAHVLRLDTPITNFSGASGDTLYDYVLVFCFLVIALAISVIWSFADRRRSNYELMYAWLRVYVRFALGTVLVRYGSAKLFPSQFSSPAFFTLSEPFGQASPMGLLWTFMGASRPYSIFAGAAEFVSGVLLFVPWTEALGALLGAVVMSNVVALNFCYDVPVKLYSLHLLLMCLFVGWSGIMRILSLLVLNHAKPLTDVPVFARRSWQKGFLAIQVGLGIILAGTSLNNVHRQTAKDQNTMATLPYGGFWTVDDFTVDGDVSTNSVSEVPRWTQFVLDSPYVVLLQSDGGFRQLYRWTTDADKKSLTLSHADNGSDVILGVEVPAQDRLILKGPWHGHVIEAHLHRAERPKFLLLTRRFHWISEYPFNR
jgi:hypothetical protein